MDQGGEALLMLAIIVAFPFVFVGFWSFVCALLGAISGWTGLARQHGTERDAPATSWGGLSGRMRLVNYSGVLRLGAADDGLDLRVMFMFRPGHPPLRIPWRHVIVENERAGLLGNMVAVRLGADGPLLKVYRRGWATVADARKGLGV